MTTHAQQSQIDLNHAYRHGGNIVEDRESGRDCVSQMALVRKRPDVLANHLRAMGITEDGDELADDEL
jgi:hypothetical protein